MIELAPIRVLGIDPSLVATGYAVVDGAGKCLKAGTLEPTNPAASQRQRGCEIAYKVARIAEDRSLAVTHVVMELPVQGRQYTMEALTRLNGAIGMGVYIVTLGKVPVIDVRVSEWRDALQIPKFKRNEKDKIKGFMHVFAETRWPLTTFDSPDAAEAALIALRGVMHVHGALTIKVTKRKVKRK